MPVGLQRGCFAGERGMPRPCRGWKSLREWARVCVYVCMCVSCLTMCATVCMAYSRCEQKAQARDTERKDMHDLLTALWCVLPKKKRRPYVTKTSSELM